MSASSIRRLIQPLARELNKSFKSSDAGTVLTCAYCRIPCIGILNKSYYSTDTVQGIQGNISGLDVKKHEEIRYPEGIQGEDCANFKLWLESCRKYGLYNCDEQIEQMYAGRKTLAQVLQEQEDIIYSVAKEYQKNNIAADSNLAADGVQGAQGSNEQVMELLSRDDPCPQGIQGEDCERFKLWLQNCARFGFQNCDQQLLTLQSGRKTLQDIFREQEAIIHQAAQNFSSAARSDGISEVSSGSTANSPDVPANLSQRQKLQRAIKDYGATVVVFHIGISLLSLGGFYLAVSSGLDVVGLLGKIGVGQSILESRLATGASTFVVAYAVHKVFAPVRIGITLTCTPLIVRHLRQIGFLKSPKSTLPK